MESKRPSTPVSILIPAAVWFATYFLFVVTSRRFLTSDSSMESFVDKLMELTMLQHLLGTVLSILLIRLMGKSILSPAFDHKLGILVAAICNVVGNLAMNVAFITIPSNAAHVMETCQPLVTLALLVCVHGSLDFYTLFSVCITVLGVSVFPIYAGASFNTLGLAMAIISVVAFSARSLLLKKLSDVWNDPLQKFAAVSSISFLLFLPIWLIKLAVSPVVTTTGIVGSMASSVFYPMYSVASFKVLENVGSPVTHAILAVMVRPALYFEGVGYPFCVSFNYVWNILAGIVIVVIGIYLYQQRKWKTSWLVVVTAVLLSNYFITLESCQPSDQLQNESRISMAWVYEKQFPLSNLQALAQKNPNFTIHVYCRVGQCSKNVTELNEPNVAVEITAVSDMVEDTPLERWLASQDSLTGDDEFENHLQEVMILGTLWKYGGLYVSPTVINTQPLPLDFTAGESAWVGKEVKRPDNRLPSELDVVYFPFQNQFLFELLSVYAAVYQKVHFNFHDMVWRAVQARYGTKIHLPVRKNVKDYFSIGYGVHTVPKSSPTKFNPPEIKNAYFSHGEHNHTVSGTNYITMTTPPRNVLNRQHLVATNKVGGFQYLPFLDSFSESKGLGISNLTLFDSEWGASNENWLPPSDVTPIMLSVQVSSRTEKVWEENISYFRDREPIGCRDSRTLAFMKQHGTRAFISGSLIFLLDAPRGVTREGILVDLHVENRELLPRDVRNRAIFVEQVMTSDSSSQLQQALQLKTDFGSASLVITQHVEHALMCAAMKTPVIFISCPGGSKLDTELPQLVHAIDLGELEQEKAMLWLENFPWSDIQPNPNLGTMMRYRATSWDVLHQNNQLLEAARRSSFVPMSPLAEKQVDLLFHLIFTTSKEKVLSKGKKVHTGEFNWRHMRTVESILYHHPTSRIIVHSNTLTQEVFDVLTEVGYSIAVQKYNLQEMLKDSPAEFFISQLEGVRKGGNWYSHETDLIRLLVMYSDGGVYLDTDMVLLRPLTSIRSNTLGYQKKNGISVNGAFMIFEKKNPFIRACLDHFAHHYSKSWGANGPRLLSYMWKQFRTNRKDQVHVMSYEYFYPISWNAVTEQAFEQTSGKKFESNMNLLKSRSYAIHLNSKITGNIGWGKSEVKPGSIASYVLNSYCVLCDRMY